MDLLNILRWSSRYVNQKFKIEITPNIMFDSLPWHTSN